MHFSIQQTTGISSWNSSDWYSWFFIAASIISTLLVVIRYIVKSYIKDIIHEIKPNGGSSIKDQVTRVEKDIESLKEINKLGEEDHKRLDSKIDSLMEIFVNYIASRKNND